MAFDFSKLNIFGKLNARTRVLVLAGSVIGLVFLVYLGASMLGGGSEATGPSRVAQAPSGLQTVPGGQQSAEFSRAIEQANLQRAEQAAMTGQSAVPTVVRMPGRQAGQADCIICKEEQADVASDLDAIVSQGKLTKTVADELKALAKNNVLPDEYAERLAQLVKEGKLTPAQARQLLGTYRKQYNGKALQESEEAMDQLIKNGQLSIGVANELLELQRQKLSTSDYAAKLREMVNSGKLTAASAQALLAQYTQQRAKEVVAISVASLNKMAKQGQITPTVEKALIELEKKRVPLKDYEAALNRYVEQGQMTPAVSQAILDEFKWQKSEVGPAGTMTNLQAEAEHAAAEELVELLQEGKITTDTANFIRELISRDVSMQDFQAGIAMLVEQKRLTPDIAKLKIADYQAIRTYRDLMKTLRDLQNNNASPKDYANALKEAVRQGSISPEQANQLMQEYQAVVAAPRAAPTTTTGAATTEFARLQQRLQQSSAKAQTTTDFSSAVGEISPEETQTAQEAAAAHQLKIKDLMAAMSGQAQQLITSWQPPTMASKVRSEEIKGDSAASGGAPAGLPGEGVGGQGPGEVGAKPVVIKAGQIIFAVLDTEVNSDYPDSPVLATIVDGKYKGAKLLGKLQTTKGVTGQQDRISLNFTLMNVDAWPKSKSITAFAIDPDTARSSLASRVNYHYMQKFGAIMATSFLQGYGKAVESSAATSTTGIFGTSTTNPELSPTNKLAVALGQMGKELGKATENYVKLPPTVKVDSGVGLGILFMSDVTE